MPVIKLEDVYGHYSWGLVGLGADATIPASAVSATPFTAKPAGFLDGVWLWLTPSMAMAGITNLGTLFSAAPMAALGLLAPPAALLLLLVGGSAGSGYVAARRRYRGRAANPGRRHIAKRRNPSRRKTTKRSLREYRASHPTLTRLSKTARSYLSGRRSRSRKARHDMPVW